MTQTDIVKSFIDGYAAGDTERVLELFAEDAEFTFGGYPPVAQEMCGKDRIRDFLRRRNQWMEKNSPEFKIFVCDLVASENKAAAEWVSEFRSPDGVKSEAQGTTFFDLRGDKIVKVKGYIHTPFETVEMSRARKELAIVDLGELSLIAWRVI